MEVGVNRALELYQLVAICQQQYPRYAIWLLAQILGSGFPYQSPARPDLSAPLQVVDLPRTQKCPPMPRYNSQLPLRYGQGPPAARVRSTDYCLEVHMRHPPSPK